MKKYFILVFILIAGLVFGAYFSLFSRQAEYHRTLASIGSSVLVLENFDRTKVKIVTGDTDMITFDLKGDEDDISSISQSEDGLFKRFGISAEFSGLSGTITVPPGTLIDVTLSSDTDLKITDLKGKQELQGADSFLVDTTTLNSFEFNGSDSIQLDSWGDLTLWDDDTWEPLENDSSSDNSSDEPLYCGIGSQAVRNYCCVLENEGVSTPQCDGTGYFVFDNVLRDCAFKCDAAVGEGEGEDEDDSEAMDCGVGGQTARNACCADQHAGEYQGCLGSWIYNNAASDCQFQCDTYDPGQSPPAGGDDGGFDDPVSTYCSTIQNPDDRDLCCNDTLKTPLSSGPYPGFPDCIGKWHFNIEAGCEFTCADYVEMTQILNEIRETSQ